jgi:hypothetical protein
LPYEVEKVRSDPSVPVRDPLGFWAAQIPDSLQAEARAPVQPGLGALQ